MKLSFKILIIVLALIIGFRSTLIVTYATSETIEPESTVETLLDELANDVIEEGLGSIEDIIASTVDKIDELELEISDEKKLEVLEFILNESGTEYSIDEVEQQLKDAKQTISDIKEAFKIVGELLGEIIDTFKKIIESITNWFNEFKQTEDYDNIVKDINNLSDIIESAANEIENEVNSTEN